MVRSCKNDNVKCDGLAMVARGISSDNGYLRWEWQCQLRIARSGGKGNIK